MDDSGKTRNQEQEESTMSLVTNETRIDDDSSIIVSKRTSLGKLITWNISKALEKNPTIDMKDAMCAAQGRLDEASNSDDIHSILSENTYQRYLVCALLAWQELGHHDADSLCRFYENSLKEQRRATENVLNSGDLPSTVGSKEFVSKFAKAVESSSSNPYTMGPVVKLPVETKIVMRVDNTCCSANQSIKPKGKEKDVMSKIDQACCLESACVERLAAVDSTTAELRSRATKLARREAERVELLERAEAAWRDLENGFQRRLKLAVEKEEDTARLIQKVIDERNTAKSECATLAQQLQGKSDKAEKDRARLSVVENEVCTRACTRLKLSEESAKGDSVVAEQQCRAAQADRDLQFKEEQARRKVSNMQSELDSARALSHETDRALREELSALRAQIEKVSNELLSEADDTERIKAELEDMRKEKLEMIEDLEGCQQMCDGRMKVKMDELKKKRDQLAELKGKVMDCRCKLPVDVTVEARRTPSLAALCKCTPEDKILGSCSCTSLRDRLLSNLMSDLFSGLQGELDGAATLMPCQLLKCLEDKHNWDRASIVKTNLTNYFTQLLVSELDIAIATSIEKYHVKWVGQTCADRIRMIPEPGDAQDDGWQQRAIEKRAQKLASELAEQLFQDKADELTKQANEVVSSGPPPCECKPKETTATQAAFPCLVSKMKSARPSTMPIYWHQAFQDVNQLKMQIEDLKKDAIKKEDLRYMENKFTKIIQRASGGTNTKIDFINSTDFNNDSPNKDKRNTKTTNNSGLQPLNRKRCIDTSVSIKKPVKHNHLLNSLTDKTFRPTRKNPQTYAVNVCLCSQNVPKDQHNTTIEKGKTDKTLQRVSKDVVSEMISNVKQTKPISSGLTSQDNTIKSDSKTSDQQSCPNNCVCFHKIPSSSSIDKLLDTLAKWKYDLDASCNDEAIHKDTSLLNETNKELIKDAKQSFNYQKNDLTSKADSKENFKKIKSESSNASKDKVKTRVKEQNDECIQGLDNSSIQPRLEKNLSNVSKKSRDISPKSNDPIAATESEYIGAINLDKSIEESCKCEDEIITKTSNGENRSTVFKCIASSKCKCKKSLKKKSFTKKDTNQEVLSSTVNVKKEVEDTELKKFPKINEVDRLQNKSIHRINDPKTLTNTSDPCERSYQISFLGVTLADANPQLDHNDIGEYCELKEQNKIVNKTIGLSDNLTSINDYIDDILKCTNDCTSTEQTDCDQNNILNLKLKNNKKYVDPRIQEAMEGRYEPPKKITVLTKSSSNYTNKNLSNSLCSKDCPSSKYSRMSNQFSKNQNKSKPSNSSVHHSSLDIAMIPNNSEEDKLNSNEINSYAKNSHIETSSCQCNVRFDEFKKFINDTFSKQIVNDIALDVQSFSNNNKQEESCVCCEKVGLDESSDLEENTFALLEEYLKKKLAEFKESSCSSSCIPPEEEQTLFTIILERVKKLISDSTNQIACKCSSEEEKTQGSWNRAYGLLQEYLKTKIKKVQCSCILAEDNKDSILPSVLEKICNLIEYDFKRLKDVCGCKNDKKMLENIKQLPKQDYYGIELPEKDLDIMVSKTLINCTQTCPKVACDKVIDTASFDMTNVKQDMSLQVPSKIGTQVKSCSPMEIHNKNLQTVVNYSKVAHSENTNKDCICIPKIAFINTNENCAKRNASLAAIPKFSITGTHHFGNEKKTEWKVDKRNKDSEINKQKSSPYLDYALECNPGILKLGDDNTTPVKSKTNVDILLNSNKKYSHKVCNRVKNYQTLSKTITSTLDSYEKKTSDLEQYDGSELIGNNEASASQIKKNYVNNSQNNLISGKQSNTQNKQNGLLSQNDISFNEYHDGPYIGYTVECSCNPTLGTCVCPKSISKAESDKINNIWKKYVPDETYFKNVSYIMASQPVENGSCNPISLDIIEDSYLKGILKNKTVNKVITYERDTDISINNNEDFVLKNSTDDLQKSNMMTDTVEDNISVDTEYSNNDDALLDWCECCSNLKPIENSDSDRLKRSLYFPASLDFDDNYKEESITQNAFIGQRKHCDCDMVPICHVKMLVENIESKLATAKCTCDSLSPHVCPEHSANV